jgi:hypothetical protein
MTLWLHVPAVLSGCTVYFYGFVLTPVTLDIKHSCTFSSTKLWHGHDTGTSTPVIIW